MDDAVGQLLSLDGKVAVVTGAATGIGEGIASLLAAAGAHVVVADRDAEGAERVAKELGGSAAVVDVTDEAGVDAMAERLFAEHGGVDVLVNNAGTYLDAAGSIVDQPYDRWRRTMAVNLDSAFLCSRSVSTRMISSGRGGAIVTISSVDAFLPCLGVGYDVAKAGVVMLTRSLAVDLAPFGIRVNGVGPGMVPVETLRRMRAGELPPVFPPPSVPTGLMGPLMQQRSANIPLKRPGTPDDIARAVLFLSTEASSYVTGQTLLVDGGWTLV